MEVFSHLLASNERQTFEFFVVGLKDVLETDVDERELLYTASVLAHHAQVSTQAARDVPAPTSLVTLFDQFVLDQSVHHDGTLLETAGAQCLLLAGFFERQMKARHSIRYYSQLGSTFFRRAGALTSGRTRGALLDSVGQHFEPWRARCARLSRDLDTQRLLIGRQSLD